MKKEFTSNEIYLFGENHYKYMMKYAVQIYCQLLKNRNTMKLDVPGTIREVHYLACELAQDWCDREKARGNNETIRSED